MIEHDKFYTEDSVVDMCLNFIESTLGRPMDSFSRIVEPSAGAGAFLLKLPSKAVGYDLYPEHKSIIKQDYTKLVLNYDNDSIVIGNPPFGRAMVLGLNFIKRALTQSRYVAFILPVNYSYKIPYGVNATIVGSLHLGLQNYSGIPIDCTFVIYEKCMNDIKRYIKDVSIYNYRRGRHGAFNDEWLSIDADIRISRIGNVSIIGDGPPRLAETIIVVKDKMLVGVVMSSVQSLIDMVSHCGSFVNITVNDIINKIYDDVPELRSDVYVNNNVVWYSGKPDYTGG